MAWLGPQCLAQIGAPACRRRITQANKKDADRDFGWRRMIAKGSDATAAQDSLTAVKVARLNNVAIEYSKQGRPPGRGSTGPRGRLSGNYDLPGDARADEAGFRRFSSVSTPNAAKIMRHGSIGTE